MNVFKDLKVDYLTISPLSQATGYAVASTGPCFAISVLPFNGSTH